MAIHVYILRRLLLMLPTLAGITLITFTIVNLVPGGPIEQKLQSIRFGSGKQSAPRSASGISDDVIKALEKQYGFDKPVHERYWLWLKRMSHFDFGESYVYSRPVMDIIKEAFPVSIQFGVGSLILTYSISVILGLTMARFEGRWVDRFLGSTLIATSALPAFVIAVLLLVFFAGGRFFSVFPLGYLQSENYHQLSLSGKIVDRLHHFVLPMTAYLLGSFTSLSFLCRNSVLGEIKKDYIRTARAIGVAENKIYLKHAFRNALIPLITGIGGFLALFLSGSVLVETIFQLNGIGLLSYTALMSRDYNVIMALAFLQSVALLLGNLIGDLVYMLADPRIDFAQPTE